nr:immunoglobulin heavy chain junction region [Mus musculus]NSM04367.1 immunoglobulin heavy chain junction region [Mus musculus]NSM04381.1 immunoglobulin heavy chain junction region [Mus musculus]NSM04472.1 immunoglobulin heavy chain junction region [Mus musculus]NSM05011.1 immunoglobulin heavy chain junction region [Mus musculus]
CVTGYSNYGYW